MEPLALAHVLHPMPFAEFVRDVWEQRHLHLHRGASAYYDATLPIETLARLPFTLTPLGRTPDGNPVAVRSPVELMGPAAVTQPRSDDERGWILEGYERGATVRVNDVQHRNRGVRELCESVHAEIGAIVGANLYLARAGAPGGGVHVDPHDTYILQLRGRKRWSLYAGLHEKPVVSLPALSSARPETAARASGLFLPRDPAGVGELITSLTLEQGDFLYVPRGTYHEVVAMDVDTLHVTIGAWPITFIDWLNLAVSTVARDDVRLRAALPPGMLRTRTPAPEARAAFAEAVRAFAEHADAGVSAAALADLVATHGFPRLRRGDTAAQAARIDPSAVFERVGGVEAGVVAQGPRMRVTIGDAVLDLPARFGAALRHVLSATRVTTASLPGGLDDESRSQLIDRLCRQGLLRRVPNDAGT